MKNLKIFPKTFLYTFSILGGIILIVHILVYLLFPIFYLEDRKQELNIKANTIVESLKGVDEKSVESVLNVYAKNNHIMAFLKKDEKNEAVMIGSGVKVDTDSKNNSIIIEDRTARTKDGKTIKIQVISGTEMVKEATKVTLQFLPYTLMTAILFSVIFSYFYSKKLVKPLIEIAKTTRKMQELDRDARFVVKTSDEIGEVGSQINQVYKNLLNVIDDLEVKNQKMVNMEKMKVDFLRNTSHELKTPLAGLRIILENMQYDIGKYKDKDKYLKESIDIVDKMSHMVKDILDLSKLQEWGNSREEVFIRGTIEEILDDYKVIATSKRIKINIDLKNEKIYMGKAALEKAISNIIGNAVKYTDENGKIDIVCREGRLIVRNTCKPLSEDEIQGIFEIFYQGKGEFKESYGGNGLGLYMVKNIMDRYGVEYWFKPYEIFDETGNIKEKGMEFSIEI